MKCRSIVPLVIAGALLGASPALARDHGPTVTVSAFFGLPVPPPPVVIVRPPVPREVIVVERDDRHRHRHHKHDHGRRHLAHEKREWRSERDCRHDHGHDRRGHHGDDRVVAKHGRDRWRD